MPSIAEINQMIADDAAACVERERNGDAILFGISLKPRRAYEPGCKQKANAKYANQLAAAQAENDTVNKLISDSFVDQLTKGNSEQLKILGLAMIFVIIAIIIIY